MHSRHTSISASGVRPSASGRKVDSDGTVDSVVVDIAVLGLCTGGIGSCAGSVLADWPDAVLDWLWERRDLGTMCDCERREDVRDVPAWKRPNPEGTWMTD